MWLAKKTRKEDPHALGWDDQEGQMPSSMPHQSARTCFLLRSWSLMFRKIWNKTFSRRGLKSDLLMNHVRDCLLGSLHHIAQHGSPLRPSPDEKKTCQMDRRGPKCIAKMNQKSAFLSDALLFFGTQKSTCQYFDLTRT